MVAETIDLPNIRKFFIPDPGCYIAEADLSGADAQVVAWEAEDEDLKEAFRKGLKLHIKNAKDIFPEKCKGLSDEALKLTDRPGGVYHDCKRGVHATNYHVTPRSLAGKLGWLVSEADRFIDTWFSLHPGIREWHFRVERQLSGEQCWRCNSFEIDGPKCVECGATAGRRIGNKFGYFFTFFDRIERCLPKALAWTPQSTVAHNTELGTIDLDETLGWVDILLQVHDSLVFQYPISMHNRRSEIKDVLTRITPYSDPLIIPWSFSYSDRSWGDAEPASW